MYARERDLPDRALNRLRSADVHSGLWMRIQISCSLCTAPTTSSIVSQPLVAHRRESLLPCESFRRDFLLSAPRQLCASIVTTKTLCRIEHATRLFVPLGRSPASALSIGSPFRGGLDCRRPLSADPRITTASTGAPSPDRKMHLRACEVEASMASPRRTCQLQSRARKARNSFCQKLRQQGARPCRHDPHHPGRRDVSIAAPPGASSGQPALSHRCQAQPLV